MKIKKIICKYQELPIQFKCSVAYFVASMLTNGLSFLTTPIFTRILSTADMGEVTAFNTWQAILSAVVSLSLGSGSFSIAMVEFKDKRDGYMSSILTLSTISTAFFFGFYLVFENKLNLWLKLDSDLMLLMFGMFLLTPAMTFWLLRERFEYKYKSVLVVTVSSAFFSTIISVVTVLWAKKNGLSRLGASRLFGSIVPTLVISAVVFLGILVRGKTFINKQFWAFSLKLSLPLIVHTLAKHVLDLSDRIMIENYLGKSELGIYGVLYTVSSLSLIIWSAINSSLIPISFEKLEKEKFDELNSLLKPIILIYAICCALLSLFSPEIVRIISTSEYYSAIYLMPPIAAGIFFTSVYTIFGNILTFYKKPTQIMLSTLLAAGLNVFLNYLFIPKYGVIAASYTTLIAYILLTVFQLIAVEKIKKDTFIGKKYLGIMILGTLTWALLCNVLYKIFILRMITVVIIAVVCIIKRDWLISKIKIIKRKR